MSYTLRNNVNVFYRTKDNKKEDITKFISPDLISFAYTDKTSKEVDEVVIKLKDEEGKWRGAWIPKKGDQLTVIISSENHGTLFCGEFNVDTIQAGGPPHTLTIKALAVPFGTKFRRTKKNKAWEGVTLQEIASAICSDSAISLQYDTEINPYFERKDQKGESDSLFLERLCSESGLESKLGTKKFFIFAKKDKEQKDSIKTISLSPSSLLGLGSVLSWELSTQISDTAKEVKVSYFDPISSEVYSAVASSASENVELGHSYSIIKRVESAEEAKRIAEAELSRHNKLKIKGTVTVIGDVSLFAGENVQLSGFGWFDGKYLIDASVHSMPPYTTKLELINIEAASDYLKEKEEKAARKAKREEKKRKKRKS